MSAPNKSFFSGLTGLITGIAGIVTAAVALLGLAANHGWLSSSAKPASRPGAATAQTTGGAAGTTGTTSSATPQYAVDPTSIVFGPLDSATASVKVSNTGVVPMTVEAPMVSGSDPSRFTATSRDCSSSVEPGRSCRVQVTFIRATGTFSATLVIVVTGAPRATEVPIKGTAIL